MSRSELGKPDPDLEGMELLFHQKGGSARCQNDAVFEWSGSRLYEPNYWIHLYSKVLKYLA
jgi:hypothetical protein